jgi:hypothetical protein
LVDYVSAVALTSKYLTHRILLTAHTRIESTNDRYRDMMMQKTMTTVVDPIVSARVGNDTFFNSPRTSMKNSRIESVNFLNMRTSPSLLEKEDAFLPLTSPNFPLATDLPAIYRRY